LRPDDCPLPEERQFTVHARPAATIRHAEFPPHVFNIFSPSGATGIAYFADAFSFFATP
jgi:hypothetical protein